jgi:hypothetical protein
MLASLRGIVNLVSPPLGLEFTYFWPHLDNKPAKCASKRLHEECNGN